ncbi:hypothetical protein PRK78_005460 [Emydomyces testavorans]|uniref:DUF1746 domain-containing protein n=1 Tax=Emydomyces testavorans TaxID=2070801 RepID=A0AAF0DKR4_9EURO|nr:hypothetical protein PRK78_005460 [Emydomyces testavorans]
MTTPDALRDAEHIADISNFPYDNDGTDELTPSQLESQLRHKKEIQAKAKTVFLDRLLRDFDLLIYCQLSSLYYMDCSIIHFAVRASVQFAFLTPKSGFEPPKNQPYIGAILTSNLLCVLLHCISSAPAAGEISRGYLHGGLFIDFIGQKGPISKLRLIAFDILIIALQIIMMGVILEKERTKAVFPSESSHSASTSSSSSSAAEPDSTQDLDSEERGVHRAGETIAAPSGHDVALGSLQPADAEYENNNNDNHEEGDSERRGLLLSTSTADAQRRFGRDVHPRDVFLTGDVVIVEMNIFQTLRDQWCRNPSTNSAESSGSTAAISPRIYFRRRLGVHFGRSF